MSQISLGDDYTSDPDTFQPCLPPWIPDDGYEDAWHIGGTMLYLVLKGFRPGVYTSW